MSEMNEQRLDDAAAYALGAMNELEAAAFRSGAALAHLSQVTAAGDVPVALWRDRLALVAAGNCAEMAGRREGPGG